MRLFTPLLVLLINGPVLSQESSSYIAHEWGTFTTLQRSNGERLNGLFKDEEVLPSFVKSISFHNKKDIPNDKGYDLVSTELRNVSVKMETPVIYFYSDKARQVHVDIEFAGGSISQWYPDRTNGEVNPDVPMLDFAEERTGWIEWDATILAPEDQASYTNDISLETPQWVRPRATQSNLIRGSDENVEKFLFYRGIGNFEVPLKVEFNTEDNLVLTNQGGDKLSYVMVYQKEHNQPATIWWAGELHGNYTKVVQRDGVVNNNENMQNGLLEFENALVKAGLYREEAKAMLETWKESYFEREGLKVFWIAPSAFTNRILPLKITPPPDELRRIIVGRSEVLTPEFEEILNDLSSDEFNQLWGQDRFYYAYVESRSSEPISEWTSTISDGYFGRISTDHIPFVAVPNPFQNKISIEGAIIGASEVIVTVYNVVGERIFKSLVPTENGAFHERLELFELVPGLFIVNVSDGQNTWSRKIVKGQ